MGLYYAKASRQNVRSHLRQLSLFCVAFKQQFLPVSKNTLLAFLELMSKTCNFGHLQSVLSSIRFVHQLKKLQFCGDDFEVTVFLRGLKRKLSKPARQVLPITPEILILMYEHIDITKPIDLAHWTAMLFAFRLLFRKSSIAPKSFSSFNPRTELSREKVILVDETVLVCQNFSKTDQYMASVRVIPLTRTPIKALDPVLHYRMLVQGNRCSGNVPAFSYNVGNVIKCVTYNSFTKYLKTLLHLVGLNPDDWSGHSFRRGGATLLYKLGVDPMTIQAAGDWSSDTFLRYLDVNFDRLWQAQRSMATYSCT